MTEQKYHLYAIKISDIKGSLKQHKYSLVANERYALVYSCRTDLPPEFKPIDGVKLSPDESEWLTACKAEIIAKAMKDNESDYAEVLDEFASAFENALKEEQQKLHGEKK